MLPSVRVVDMFFSMGYLPINVDVTGLPCLVVGGGPVAERKIMTLWESGAQVRLVSQELTPGLQKMVAIGKVTFLGPEFVIDHLTDISLVFAATSDQELNDRISRQAKARGLWVNVADQPELCSFFLPATVKRGDLTISVSTNGHSPALAARLRTWLEEEIGPEYGLFVELMGRIRPKVLAERRPSRENRIIFQSLLDSELLDCLALGDLDRADDVLQRILGPGHTLETLGLT